MTARVHSAVLFGIDAVGVEIEAKVIGSLRRFSIVGLPDGVVREARERVRCAIENSGYAFPHSEVIVNLSPASLPKYGAGFDLAIALSILQAVGEVHLGMLDDTVVAGELALDGALSGVNGALALALYARTLKRRLLVPPTTAASASHIRDAEIYQAGSLAEAVALLSGRLEVMPVAAPLIEDCPGNSDSPDYGDVVGQFAAKRVMEIAAAGGHNVLLVGPPGSGKSMLAQRLSSILPPLDETEALEVSRIYQALDHLPLPGQCGRNGRNGLVRLRPFRAPHHTMSTAGLVGGGPLPLPGEISLAHCGVLFLDELAEMKRDALEALRQPLEAKHVFISRAQRRVRFPAAFLLIAAMNPCPCGWHGSSLGKCSCTPVAIKRYVSRVSGPILDRFDLHVWVPSVQAVEFGQDLPQNPTADMRRRVSAARKRQEERFERRHYLNADINRREAEKHCRIGSASRKLIEAASQRFLLSARAYMKVLKVARTIADLEGCEEIETVHVAEALGYRNALPT